MAYTADSVSLVASDATASDLLGSGVCVNGNGSVMAVGAQGWEGASSGQGGVYIYDRTGGAWVQRGSVLTASDAGASHAFGSSVSLDSTGTILAVGATGQSTEGAVYIFDWSGSAWVERAALIKPPTPYTADKKIGYTVSFNSAGTIIAVGAPGLTGTYTAQGGAYIYDWSGSAWVLRGSALIDDVGAASECFGFSVALNSVGDMLAVGAPYATVTVSGQGKVYVYDWSGSAWIKRGGTTIVSADAAVNDRFGFGLTIGGSTSQYLGIGAPYRDIPASVVDSGSYYLFSWDGSSWTQQELFVASDPAGLDLYGQVASLSRDSITLVVSAFHWEDAITSQGTVYTYKQLSTVVEQLYTDSCSAISVTLYGFSTTNTESASAADTLTGQVIQWFFESIAANETTTSQATTSLSYAEQVAAAETLVALFNQLVADSASGAETWYIDTASMIAELSVASGVTTSQITAIQALAEVIVALELQQSGGLETISESAAAATLVSNLVRATQAILEQAVAADAQVSYLILLNAISETVQTGEAITLWQSLTQAVEDGATAFVHLSVGGEFYTGWVLNTQSSAVTEYQGLNFNSLCKIGTRYFGATETGLYELAGATDAGTSIATYIQGGILDFGTASVKNTQYAYLAMDANGAVFFGVSVPSGSQNEHRWYKIEVDAGAVGSSRVKLGSGVRSRYWRFSVASDALEALEAVTVVPVVLTRRV